MANTIEYPQNPSIGDQFTVGGTRKEWDGVKWKNVSFGNHEVRIDKNYRATEALLKSLGLSGNFGFFNKGFTYTEEGDVGIDGNNKFWIYNGSLPFEVTKGTVPSEPDYSVFDHTTAVEAHDDIYIRTLTLAEAIAEDAPVGTRYQISDWADAQYYVVEGSDTGGLYSPSMASGRKLKLQEVYGNSKREVLVDWVGAKPDDELFDNKPIIQSVIDYVGAGGVVRFRDGEYYINSHIEERTNGGRRVLRGLNRKTSKIKAMSTFSSVARGFMLWFGTDTGHFSYGLEMYDLQIDANDVAEGCLYAGEDGQGIKERCEFRGFTKYGVRTSGATDSKYEKIEFYTTHVGSWCVVATCTGGNGTQDPSGYSFSYSAVSFTPSNEIKFKDVWMSGASGCIWANGERVSINGITSQSCGDSVSDDIVVITAQPFDADDIGNNFPIAGPVFSGVNWWEGGSWRSALRISDYQGGLVEGCYVVGSSSAANAVKEQGVLVEAKRTIVRNNSFYQFFTATPTEGRLDNAAVYIESDAFGSKEYDNAYERTQQGNQPYDAGAADPTADKSGKFDVFGVIKWDAPTTPTLASSSNLVSNVVHVGTGQVAINLKYNVESREAVVLVQTGNGLGTDTFKKVFTEYKWQTDSSIRVQCFDETGAGIVPERLSFAIMCDSATQSN